jgi:hypothetical protein
MSVFDEIAAMVLEMLTCVAAVVMYLLLVIAFPLWVVPFLLITSKKRKGAKR